MFTPLKTVKNPGTYKWTWIYNYELEYRISQSCYVPPTEGGGGGEDILFLVRIPSASASLRFHVLSFEPMNGF